MGDNKGWKATLFDVAAVQARSDEILRNPLERSQDVTNYIAAAGNGPSCTGVSGKKPMDLSIKFAAKETERQKTLKQDQEYAATLNGFIDERTGRMSREKMSAAGLSEHAQNALRDAHDTVSATTAAARGSRLLSEAGLKQNHDRALMSVLKNNYEIMEYAAAAPKIRDQVPTNTANTVATASLDLGTP